MKRMKTFLAVLLALFLVIGLAACGGGETPAPTEAPTETEAPTTVEPPPEDEAEDGIEGAITLGWWGNPTRNERTTEALGIFMDEFPGIDVTEWTVGWGDYWTSLMTMAASNDLPDVIQQDWAQLETYVANGLLMDLTPFIESGDIDLSDVPESVINTGRIGDGIYAISVGTNGASMIYNETLLNELGITINDNMSIEEFVDIAREVYAETGVRADLVFADPSNPLESMLRAQGITMLTPEGMGGEIANYTPFFELVAQGIEEGWHIRPEQMIWREGMDQDPLVLPDDSPSETTWMGLYFSNMLSGLQGVAPEGMVLGITTYPSENPAQSNFVRAAMYFSITTHTDNPAAAAALINFWTNSVEANSVLLGERGIPASSVVTEAIAPLTGEAGQRMADFVAKVSAPGNSSPVNPPRPEGSGEIVDHLRFLIENITHGTMTPEAAAEDFFNFGNNILG